MIPLAVILFAAVALLMVAGGIPVGGDAQVVIFRTPVFALLLGLLCVLLVLSCVRYGRALRRAAFWPAHLGIVLILLGAGLGVWLGKRGDLALPVGGGPGASQLPAAPGGTDTALGFDLSVADFNVAYYAPVYRLYKPTVDSPRSAEDYALAGDLPVAEAGGLRVAGYGDVPRETLWDAATAAWRSEVALANGWILHRGRQTPKRFEATLKILVDGVASRHTLAVNKPVAVKGWRIYLMSYELENGPQVTLHLRCDPGRNLAIVGIWLTIAGTVLLCWRPGRSRSLEGAAR